MDGQPEKTMPLLINRMLLLLLLHWYEKGKVGVGVEFNAPLDTV